MKKRLFAIMLALAMLLAAVPALAEEVAVEQDNTAGNNICATDKCNNPVANEGDICTACANQNAKLQSEQSPVEKNNKDYVPVITDDANQDQQNEKKETKQEEILNDPVQPTEEHVCKLKYTFNNEYPNGKCVHEVTCEAENCTEYPQPKNEDCIFDTKGWSTTNPKYDVDNTVRPTCEQGGKGAVQCSKCGHISYMNTAKLGHDLEQINGSQATCTEPAHGTYWKCKRCNALFSDANGNKKIDKIPTIDGSNPLGHQYEYHWGTWDCKTKTITAYRKCSRSGCDLKEKPTTISFSEKDRDTWYSCGKKYTTVSYEVTAAYSDATVKYGGKAECTYSSSDYCRPDWYYDPCYYNNPCGHWGCGSVCTRYSNCVPCQNYRTTFRVGGYNCLATPKTGDASVIAPAMLALIGAAGAMLGKKRR